MTPALALERVTCTFSGAPPYTALRDVSLRVAPGEFVSVVGPTGCGKSTLLNIAAGLIVPTSGAVHIEGELLQGLNRRAGYLFQAEALMPWRSACENVAAATATRTSSPAASASASRWRRR